MTEYKVVKANKRLYITNEKGEYVYTPPDFLLPLQSRDRMVELANTNMTIQDIIEFEVKNTKRKRK